MPPHSGKRNYPRVVLSVSVVAIALVIALLVSRRSENSVVVVAPHVPEPTAKSISSIERTKEEAQVDPEPIANGELDAPQTLPVTKTATAKPDTARPPEWLTIYGRAIFATTGRAAPNVRVYATYSQESISPSGVRSRKFHSNETTTDSNGEFLLPALGGRAYEVGVSDDRFQVQDGPVTASPRRDGQDEEITLVLDMSEGTGDIEGYVTINGVPANAELLAKAAEFIQTAETDQRGYYIFPGLEPGDVGLWVSVRVGGVTIVQHSKIIPVGEDEISRFDVDFAAGTGSIGGSAKVSGYTSKELTVNAWHIDRPGPGQHVKTQVNDSGEYVLEGMSSGEWRVSLNAAEIMRSGDALLLETIAESGFKVHKGMTPIIGRAFTVHVNVKEREIVRYDFPEDALSTTNEQHILGWVNSP